jgi:arginine-tRNA-protein transferase
VARLLQRIVEEPRPCSYLDERLASLEHQILLDTTSAELEALLVRGWRRFGPDYFRPGCAPCHECVPTRVPTRAFVASKSQRRARQKCAELRATVGPPRVDRERLALYEAWHSSREEARSWPSASIDERSYRLQFAFPHPAAREVAFHEPGPRGDRLVGVGICDQTPNAWSAVYFFYDPGWAPRSIGVANVVFQIELARRLGIEHVYLGYRVSGCASMEYKARFQPQERLVGWPEPGEAPRWERVDAEPHR